MDRALKQFRRWVIITDVIFLLLSAGLIWEILMNQSVQDFLFQERQLPVWLQNVLVFLFDIRPNTNFLATLAIWLVVLPMAVMNAIYIRKRREYLTKQGLWESEQKKTNARKNKVFFLFLSFSILNLLFVIAAFPVMIMLGSSGEAVAITFMVGIFTLLINTAITIISKIV